MTFTSKDILMSTTLGRTMDLCFEMLHLVTGSTIVINNVMVSTVTYLGPHNDDFIDFMDIILSGITSQNAI